jgi:hypothetical protein
MTPRPRSIGSTYLTGSAFVVVLTLSLGCASMQNTTQQEYVWEMGRICDSRSNTWYMDKVDADGRYTIVGATNSIGGPNLPYFDCMKEQYKAHPFLDWARAQKRDAQQPRARVEQVAAAGTPVQSAAIMAPSWQMGDEWQYAYKSPSDSGSYVWSVDRIEMLNGAQHYVVKAGTREIFYRVSDFASSLERLNGVVVVSHTPPRLNFAWPLTVGKRWEQSHRDERPVERQTTDRNSLWVVESEETVTVPAGTFRTMKITWRNKNTNAVNYEMWYAPEAKQWVKIREVLSNGIRERELIAFKLK